MHDIDVSEEEPAFLERFIERGFRSSPLRRGCELEALEISE